MFDFAFSAVRSPQSVRFFPAAVRVLVGMMTLNVAAWAQPSSGSFAISPKTSPMVSPPARTSAPPIAPSPVAAPPTPIIATPPQAQAYVVSRPGAVTSYGRTLVPASFLANGLGASVGQIAPGRYRMVWFGHEATFFPYQRGALFDGQQVSLPALPQIIKGELYVPWVPLAQWMGLKWTRVSPPAAPGVAEASTTFLLQYPAAFIEEVRSDVSPERTRVVLTLSNATRITASQSGVDTKFYLSGARRSGVPATLNTDDYLMPRAVTQSGNWKASFSARTNYVAPVRWFTLGNPPRLVIDFQRLFEESSTRNVGGGLSLTRVRKGTSHGPVQMFLARIDPDDGWRLRVVPGGYSVMQRARPSKMARTNRALIGVNGGFFAPDGAAVGALLVNGEWLRLPWKARTAIAFRPDGRARIGNLQAQSSVAFGSGLQLPIRDLNGWPDPGTISVLTRRFGTYYKLRAGEMAVVVNRNVVLNKPGGGNAPIYPTGFTLVASGGARVWLDKIKRGEKATLRTHAPGWDGFTNALGGGPRLVKNGRVEVTDLKEAFRDDVRVGLGPRTALGIDKQGRYILLVVDGRQGFYSSGLTLRELAATMQKFGAVDALNLDGGGSTAMTVRGQVINRPSDGTERSVANVLLVMR